MKEKEIIEDLLKYWKMYGDVDGYRCIDRWERELRKIIAKAKRIKRSK